MAEVTGAFSIAFRPKEMYDDNYAVDWDWQSKGCWSISARSGCVWHNERGFDEEAYAAIIRRFGLEKVMSKLSLEKTRTMSPSKLIAIRRELERQYSLPHLEVIGDTVGGHYPAEKYD